MNKLCLTLLFALVAAAQCLNFGSSVVPDALIAELQTALKPLGVAYCPPAVIRARSCSVCKDVGIDDVAVFENRRTDAVAFAAVDHAEKRISYYFRGSHTLKNWVNNFLFLMVPVAALNARAPLDVDALEIVSNATDPRVENRSRGMVLIHQGFLAWFDSIKDQLFDHLARASETYPGYGVAFLGHSSGGALASIAALFAAHTLPSIPSDRISLVTLNAPRTGNVRFARALENAGLGSVRRIVNGNDFAAKALPRAVGFMHTPRQIFIAPNNVTVFCDDDGGRLEDSDCMNKIAGLSKDSHSRAWGIETSARAAGC